MSTNRSGDATGMMSEVTGAAADMLPMDMVKAIAGLADPAAVAKEMPWLAGELTKIALGQSDIAPDQRDQRFADEAWRTIPSFRMLGQSSDGTWGLDDYLAAAEREWLIARSGSERPARKTLGNRQYPPLGPAPGTYVYE